MFVDTFAMLNMIGFSLPTDFTAMQEQQLNQLWHGIVSMGLMTMIIAHIYIGSVGMEGALDAMNSGMVDWNWAKEHHNLWVEKKIICQPKARGIACFRGEGLVSTSRTIIGCSNSALARLFLCLIIYLMVFLSSASAFDRFTARCKTSEGFGIIARWPNFGDRQF